MGSLSSIYNLGLGSGARRSFRGHIDNSASVKVAFEPVTLRPRDQVHLDRFFLVARPELAGKTIVVAWTATATNADGVAAGTLNLTVVPEVIGIESLSERITPAKPTSDEADDD